MPSAKVFSLISPTLHCMLLLCLPSVVLSYYYTEISTSENQTLLGGSLLIVAAADTLLMN